MGGFVYNTKVLTLCPITTMIERQDACGRRVGIPVTGAHANL